MSERDPVHDFKNLSVTQHQNNFIKWYYSKIKPYLKGVILEVGSGIGTNSRLIVRDFRNNKILLTDFDDRYVENLHKQFGNFKNVSIYKLDLTKKSDIERIEEYDFAFALNVLEHIRDDKLAVVNLASKMRPNGRIFIQVPAHMFLYNGMDKAIGHYRRYRKKDIVRLAKSANLRIAKMYYFNMFSMFGWFLNGAVLGKKSLDQNLMGTFNKLVPLLRFIEENLLFNFTGISLMAVLERKR